MTIRRRISSHNNNNNNSVIMSRHIITAGPKHDPLSELDIDELVERLTPG